MSESTLLSHEYFREDWKETDDNATSRKHENETTLCRPITSMLLLLYNQATIQSLTTTSFFVSHFSHSYHSISFLIPPTHIASIFVILLHPATSLLATTIPPQTLTPNEVHLQDDCSCFCEAFPFSATWSGRVFQSEVALAAQYDCPACWICCGSHWDCCSAW